MLLLAADENFNNDIVRGVLRRKPDLDIIHIQDVGLSGTDDPAVLEWAAQENRVLLTHDVTTITRYARERFISVSQALPPLRPTPRPSPAQISASPRKRHRPHSVLPST